MSVINLIQMWLVLYPNDFSEEMFKIVESLAESLKSEGNEQAKELLKAKKTAIKMQAKQKAESAKASPYLDAREEQEEASWLLDYNPKDIAQQLTLIFFDHFKKITEMEVLSGGWVKGAEEAPNIVAMIELFNSLSSTVCRWILSAEKQRHRTKILIRLIEIALILKEHSNFHAVMAMISGFNNSAITRLNWTFKKLPSSSKDALFELEDMMSMDGSFKKYRAVLQRSANNPCIPYLGVHLQDILFIEEGNPDRIKNGEMDLINFAKHRLITDVIFSHFVDKQQREYTCPVFDRIRWLLKKDLALGTADEGSLFALSLEREPRHASRSDIK